MRGGDEETGSLFSYRSPECLVPGDHPLRVIRGVVNAALERLSGEFSTLYSRYGRASIAPEKLLRALLLQAFYGVRSERQLMEQVTYNMLFRWFIGLSMDAAVWDVTVFTKNRDRLLEGDIARLSSGGAGFWRCWPTLGSSRCCRASISRWTGR
jgi:transposase